jgi:hypothetical protein
VWRDIERGLDCVGEWFELEQAREWVSRTGLEGKPVEDREWSSFSWRVGERESELNEADDGRRC